MSSSNLPPGVSEHMIPGNRPEDIAEEEFWETLDNEFLNQWPLLAAALQPVWDGDDRDMIEAIFHYAEMARDLGYKRGFGEGKMEEQMAQEPESE
jgi:hypothetical protein